MASKPAQRAFFCIPAYNRIMPKADLWLWRRSEFTQLASKPFPRRGFSSYQAENFTVDFGQFCPPAIKFWWVLLISLFRYSNSKFQPFLKARKRVFRPFLRILTI